MSVVNELFGFTLEGSGELAGKFREAKCPHMIGRYCDGGGNRDMTRWPSENQPLAPLFDPSVGKNCNGFIPCGVCSVKISEKNWAICPRRLLSLTSGKASPEQSKLRNRLFSLAGFGRGDRIKIWSEISLGQEFNAFNVQLLLDLGRLLGGSPDRIYAGVEWQVWRNKFGVDGCDESVLQAALKLKL